MISLLEKHNTFSWVIVVVVAGVIFYISSLSFPSGTYLISIYTIIYHIISFFLLSFFLLPALVKGRNRNLIFLAIILAVLYGVSDEIHQLFVPGRHCSISDILIDLTGILLASFIYTFSLKKRNIKVA